MFSNTFLNINFYASSFYEHKIEIEKFGSEKAVKRAKSRKHPER